MNELGNIARKYFEAFHAGRLDEVLGYFADGGVVQYGIEPEKLATEFFPESRDLIASIRFETHGIYTSLESKDVLIHFSYSMPHGQDAARIVEAVDIIEFDDHSRIKRVKVIPNG